MAAFHLEGGSGPLWSHPAGGSRPVFGWISDSAFGRFSTPLLGSFLTVDFGWFCPGLQFTVKRRARLAKLGIGPPF